jgi:hypothetical protein
MNLLWQQLFTGTMVLLLLIVYNRLGKAAGKRYGNVPAVLPSKKRIPEAVFQTPVTNNGGITRVLTDSSTSER